MKPHPDLNIADMLRALLAPENLPDRVGGGATMEERLYTKEKTVEFVTMGNVKVLCTGCGLMVHISEATVCECMGFVCNHCRALETEGICEHEPPEDPEEAA